MISTRTVLEEELPSTQWELDVRK